MGIVENLQMIKCYNYVIVFSESCLFNDGFQDFLKQDICDSCATSHYFQELNNYIYSINTNNTDLLLLINSRVTSKLKSVHVIGHYVSNQSKYLLNNYIMCV